MTIHIEENISNLKQKIEDQKRELILLEGRLSVYTYLLSQGVRHIHTPEIIVIKDQQC